jgi:DOPA 4,5-dioxygenase
MQRIDHDTRKAWIGPSFPLDLSTLPVRSKTVPLQYPSLSASYLSSSAIGLSVRRFSARFAIIHPSDFHPCTELGYSSTAPGLSLEDRRRLGENVEDILKGEDEAAPAPPVG